MVKTFVVSFPIIERTDVIFFLLASHAYPSAIQRNFERSNSVCAGKRTVTAITVLTYKPTVNVKLLQNPCNRLMPLCQ